MARRANHRVGNEFLVCCGLAALAPLITAPILWLLSNTATKLGVDFASYGNYFSSVNVIDGFLLFTIASICAVLAMLVALAMYKKWLEFGLPWLLAALAEIALCIIYALDLKYGQFPLLYTHWGAWIQLYVLAVFGLGYLYILMPYAAPLLHKILAGLTVVVVIIVGLSQVYHPAGVRDVSKEFSGPELVSAQKALGYAPEYVGYPHGDALMLRNRAIDVHPGKTTCDTVADLAGPDDPAYYDVTLTSVGIFGIEYTTTLTRCQLNP